MDNLAVDWDSLAIDYFNNISDNEQVDICLLPSVAQFRPITHQHCLGDLKRGKLRQFVDRLLLADRFEKLAEENHSDEGGCYLEVMGVLVD